MEHDLDQDRYSSLLHRVPHPMNHWLWSRPRSVAGGRHWSHPRWYLTFGELCAHRHVPSANHRSCQSAWMESVSVEAAGSCGVHGERAVFDFGSPGSELAALGGCVVRLTYCPRSKL